MKKSLTGLAVAALLTVGSTLPGFAEDAAPPQPPVAPAPAAAPTAAAPATPADSTTVPRPSIVPKAAEPAPPSADAEPAAPRRRHDAHYRHHHYYRTAYWEPFPIFWPHIYHNRIHWSRIPWLFRF